MPAGDLIGWVGETLDVTFPFASPNEVAVTLSSVLATIWNEAGTASPSAAAGSVDTTTENGPYAFYLWTPATEGNYTGELKATVTATGYLTGQTRVRTFNAQVWPRTSLLRPFLDRARGLAADEARSLGEDAGKLSLRDYYESFLDALRAYSDANPRRVQSDVTLVGSQWEYALSTLAKVAAGTAPAAQWTPEFSEIRLVEPDVDATLQSQWFIGGGADRLNQVAGAQGVIVDPVQAKFRFAWLSPSTGDTARVEWTSPHVCTHVASSLPAEPVTGRAVHFEALCRYTAGEALERLTAKAAGTNEQQIEAQVVSYGTTFERLRRLAMDYKAQAVKAWTRRTWAF